MKMRWQPQAWKMPMLSLWDRLICRETAALIGAIKAYSVMSGEQVDTDVIDGAVNEIVVTGDIGNETGNTDEVAGNGCVSERSGGR